MGTTLTALNAGSTSFSYVLAIEGYKYLLTDGPTAAAVTAWSGSDWANALTGLFVAVDNVSRIDPWNPFNGGGRLTFYVQPDSTDQFGIDVHRKASGAETYLNGAIDRDDTTITVLDTTAFTAATSEAYIGNECFEYSAKTGTTLTASKRGKYSPFAAGGSGSPRFSGTHRSLYDQNMVQLDPVVSQQPRNWLGRVVGLWIHRNTGGTLDVLAQAQCIFAGRIAEIRDDPTSGCTVVEVEHLLDQVKDAVIGRSLMTGEIPSGVYLPSGQTTFSFTDTDTTGTPKTANTLTLTAGTYTLDDLCSQINAWLGAELAAARIYGYYRVRSPVANADQSNYPGYHSEIKWRIKSTTGSSTPEWTLTMPTLAMLLFGWKNTGNGSLSGTVTLHYSGDADTDNYFFDPDQPVRFVMARGDLPQTYQVGVTTQSGTFLDQYNWLPASIKPAFSSGLSWGIFMIDDTVLIRAAFDGSALTHISALNYLMTSGLPDGAAALQVYNKSVSDPSPIKIRQVFILERSFKTLLRELFYSTGTSGYNQSTYDDLPYGLSLGIPAALLGASFDASCDALNVADASLAVVIDKPTKLADLLAGDLMLRRANLIWKAGGLRFVSFVTPTTNAAIATLGENTKAMPARNSDVSGQRSAPIETNEWQKVYIKVRFNRAVNSTSQDDGYQSSLSFEDAPAADAQGGAGDPFTINARNTFTSAQQTGAGIEALLPTFLATQPLFSRPAKKMTRSIDQRFFEQLAAGDVITSNDNFARDPVTGARGMVSVPALVTRVRYSLGGFDHPGATTPTSQVGEVDVFYLGVTRIAAWCPSAEVDDSVSTGGFDHGYNSATKTWRTKSHEHTESSEALDASFFNVNDVCRIVEVDPSNTASPVTWTGMIVASVSTTDIAFTTAVSSPAFDNTKKYRILSDHYTAATGSQQANTYQALSTNAQVESTRVAFNQGSGAGQGTTYTGWAVGELAELPADVEAGDGKPRDTGTERGNIRLVNAIHDYKTARCSPMLWKANENSTYSSGAGYQVLYQSPLFLSEEILPANVARNLRLAPFFRSSTGASVTIRVSLMRYPVASSSFNDVDRGIYADQSWTTSSTTWAVGSEKTITTAIKPITGVVFVLIEATIHGACRGLAECIEDYRQVI